MFTVQACETTNAFIAVYRDVEAGVCRGSVRLTFIMQIPFMQLDL